MNNNITDHILSPLKPKPAARTIPYGIQPSDVQKIELSIADPRLDDYLANVGSQLLCLCPADAVKDGVGFEIPGRNAYAVKVGVYLTQTQWPGANSYSLLIVPDTELLQVLPPEYVQMLEPTTLVNFQVLAGL